MRRQTMCPAVLLTLCLLVTACSGGTDLPRISDADVPGNYDAILFRTTTGGVTRDILAQGGSLAITLNTDGTTSGRLVVPGGAEDGSTLDASLDGSWALTGTTVNLAIGADVFLNDMDFTATRDQLEGDDTFSGTRVQVVLQKS